METLLPAGWANIVHRSGELHIASTDTMAHPSVPDLDARLTMAKRIRGNVLERWEIALVKEMLTRGGYNDQDILTYFTRPTRSVNHRVIAEIRTGTKHKAVAPAGAEALDEFLTTWPDIDPQTGLSVRGDELLTQVAYPPNVISPGDLHRDPTFGWVLGYIIPNGANIPADGPLMFETLWKNNQEVRWW